MRARGWDAVILTGSDPHCSEYPAPRWKQVEWLTGFTGEAGDVVVTLDHAGLWTDTRYFIQAVRQLEGTGVELHKTRVPEQVLIPQWLAARAEGDEEFTVALDGLCFSAQQVEELSGLNVVSVPDLMDILWKDRPAVPQTPIFEIECGESRESKFSWIRDLLRERNCDAILLTSLDDIAWMLNLRGSDIDYNPLVISYLLLSSDNLVWFVLKDKVEDPSTDALFDKLSAEGIDIQSYSDAGIFLMNWSGRLWTDSSSLNYQLRQTLLGVDIDIFDAPSPVRERKAVKNPFEIEGMKAAHFRDGLAVEKFLFWLEQRLRQGDEVSEWDACVKLGQLRACYDEYIGDSFETISAYGEGAALPHYITPKTNAPVLENRGLYLCDSGAHYTDGTTDITRTVPLGECTELEREDYTLVLKGHIDLAMAVFPAGTAGCQLDALAREPLWRNRRSFGHGTGHGVGYCLSCHEGPQDIRQNFNKTPIMPGMITSDEPGIYREGCFGVRHENLILCVEDCENDFGRWLRFEPLTLCHFDTSILRVDLLTADEIAWLNAYNESVYQAFAPELPAAMADWLREKTCPITGTS